MPTRYYHSRYRLFLLTLFLLFFFTSPLAQACELWYEDDGIYKGYRGRLLLSQILLLISAAAMLMVAALNQRFYKATT